MGSSHVPDCSQTRISNILKFQEEGTQIVWPRQPLTQKQNKKLCGYKGPSLWLTHANSMDSDSLP